MNRRERRAQAKKLGRELRAQGVSKASRRVQVAQARKGVSFASQAQATLTKAISQRGVERARSFKATMGSRRARETQMLHRVKSGDWRAGAFLRAAAAEWRSSEEYRSGNHTRMMGWLSDEAQRRGYSSLTAWEKAFEQENSQLLGLTGEDELLLSAEDPYLTGMDLTSIGYRGLRPVLPSLRA